MKDTGAIWILVGIICLFAIGYFVNKGKRARLSEQARLRRDGLLAKYADAGVVDDIIAGLIRQGMTHEMVIDAWGQPVAVDRKVYRTKIKETFKYGPGPRRTYANKVVLENGIVVGWEGMNAPH